MADRYWVGGTGTWSNSDTSHWSASSGGASGASVPVRADNVFIDANSGSGAITANYEAQMTNLDTSGTSISSVSFLVNSGASVGGNLTLGCDVTGIIRMDGVLSASPTITSNGFSLGELRIAQVSGTVNRTYTLIGDLTCTGRITFASLANTGATIIDANGYNVTASQFVRSLGNTPVVTLNMGSGTWEVTGTGTAWDMVSATNLTINPSTSTIKFTNSTDSSVKFKGVDKTYNNIWFARGSSTAGITIDGSHTFNDFRDSGSVDHAILFTDSTTQTVSSFTVSGTANELITLRGTGELGWTISKSSGTVSVSYCEISNSMATGGAIWNASTTNGNVNAGGNSGWSFASLDPYTYLLKPSGAEYTYVTFAGKETYDDTLLTYDEASIFYDGVDIAAWTDVAKPTGESTTIIPVGTATGLLMSLTYATEHTATASEWVNINKPTT